MGHNGLLRFGLCALLLTTRALLHSDGHSGGVAGRKTITRPVCEGVGASECGVRLVNESSIRIELDCAAGGLCHRSGRERVIVAIAVIEQNARLHSDNKLLTGGHRVAVTRRHGRNVWLARGTIQTALLGLDDRSEER